MIVKVVLGVFSNSEKSLKRHIDYLAFWLVIQYN